METKWVLSEFLHIVEWYGRYETSAGKRAEEDRPERKSTFRFTLPQKNVENIEFIYTMKPL
ncbi:hypothetical protein C6W19_22820 [Bacillus sp. RJGP41]|nr:hypothetical protein C6W19_22820 [Bacillus sp. RJGP41]